MCPAQYAGRVRRPDRDTASSRSQAAPEHAATLQVGAADDHAEREADRVADEVIARLQSGESEAGEVEGHDDHEHRHDHVARSSALVGGAPEVGFEGGSLSADLSDRITGRRGTGAQLPTGVRRRLEDGFGTSLADVRVHDDAESASLNRAVSARAFTTGNDIFFGAGEFRPDTPEGERVLAHEIAHTQQQGGGARRTTIRRWWDFNQAKLDWSKATSIRTLKTRFVWFVSDTQGDELVVKLENQPVGLGQLTGEMHSSFGTAGSVVQKRLNTRDKAWIAGMLQAPAVAAGDSWGKFALTNPNFTAPPMKAPVDPTNANDYGRLQALNELRTSNDDLLAMTMAPGQSAEDLAKPNYGGTGYDPNVSVFRTQLERPEHARQLGKITAVDLFMGNNDRVTAGNSGNWFYDPKGAVTLIDHVDQGTGMAGKFRMGNDLQSWIDTCGEELKKGNLLKTATDALGSMARMAKAKSGDAGISAWLDQLDGGKTRREIIAANMAEGMSEQRKHLVKVFTATRYTVGGSKARSQKKSLKAVAQQTAAEDAGNAKFANTGADYYGTMKRRAEWLTKN
jgi:Domain of unknown function (DUF4157)